MMTVTPPHKPRISVPVQPFRRVGQSAARGVERAGTWADETLQAEERILEPDARGRRRILRQPVVNRLVHWLVALSTFSLFFSGFGQMPLYKRYMLSEVPGMAWTADYSVTLLLHYIGAAVLLFALSFHVWYHGLLRRAFGFLPRRGDIHESALIVRAMVTGRGEPPSMKYLAEQRLAYAGLGIALLLVVLSGIVKVVKNLPGVGLPELVVEAATMLHNVSAVVLLLLIVAHLAAFLVPSNRKLVGAMFHGKVDRDYIEHRHALWYRELTAHRPATASATQLDLSPTAPTEAAQPSVPSPVTLETAAPNDQPTETVPAGIAPPPRT
jgi:formate dehydrogenase gamma subunit